MKWFGKKSKKENLELPKLPDFPKFPELPKMNEIGHPNSLPKLPSYPPTNLGKKFSQVAIKDAVTGEKEDEEVFVNEPLKKRGMQKPLKELTREVSSYKMEKPLPLVKTKETKRFFEKPMVKEAEPIFVRLDKFEESLEMFENAKNKILGMEKILADIKRVKEEEEAELHEWKKEIQEIKNQFEIIDKEIFSKV